MKKLLLILILHLFFSCSPKPSYISGNIYWEYNEYVGSKPDAGANVSAFRLDEIDDAYDRSTTTDVNGNYKLEGLEEGEYIVIVSSNNTNTATYEWAKTLKKNYPDLNKILGEDFKTRNGLIDSLARLDLEKKIAILDYNRNENNEDIVNRALSFDNKYEKLHRDLFKTLPRRFLKSIQVSNQEEPKLQIHKLKLKDGENKTLNIDFGINDH